MTAIGVFRHAHPAGAREMPLFTSILKNKETPVRKCLTIFRKKIFYEFTLASVSNDTSRRALSPKQKLFV
jgi:hypothetical protein